MHVNLTFRESLNSFLHIVVKLVFMNAIKVYRGAGLCCIAPYMCIPQILATLLLWDLIQFQRKDKCLELLISL